MRIHQLLLPYIDKYLLINDFEPYYEEFGNLVTPSLRRDIFARAGINGGCAPIFCCDGGARDCGFFPHHQGALLSFRTVHYQYKHPPKFVCSALPTFFLFSFFPKG